MSENIEENPYNVEKTNGPENTESLEDRKLEELSKWRKMIGMLGVAGLAIWASNSKPADQLYESDLWKEYGMPKRLENVKSNFDKVKYLVVDVEGDEEFRKFYDDTQATLEKMEKDIKEGEVGEDKLESLPDFDNYDSYESPGSPSYGDHTRKTRKRIWY